MPQDTAVAGENPPSGSPALADTMAIYEYEILNADGSTDGIYEAEQKMSDPPLTRHPDTGAPLRRIHSSIFGRVSGDTSSAPSCGSGGCCGSGNCGWN